MKKLVLIVVAVLTLLPLFKPGLFDVHDPTSIARFSLLSDSMSAGQFPAVWNNSLNQGFGYPLFLYYAPVYSYLGALLKLFLPSYLLAHKLAMGILVLFASLGMYKLMRRFVSGAGALLSASAYTLLPYHASTLYVRGSYAEGVTWTLLPWLLYFWSEGVRDKRWIIKTALCTFIFLLSHNSLPFAFLPFLLYWIYLYLPKKGSLVSLYPALLAISLTAWFLLPVFFERHLVQIDSIAKSTSYLDHFLKLAQLWHSPWGYGGSAPMSQVDGMSFMIGKFHLVIFGLTIMLIAFKKSWNKNLVFALTMFAFYAFLTLDLSSFIWAIITPMQILQFPWRLLIYATFAVSFVIAYLPDLLLQRGKMFAVFILTFGLLFFNLKFFKPERPIDYSDSSFLSEEKIATLAKDKIPEYLPVTMPQFPLSTQPDGLTHTAVSVYGSLTLQEPSQIKVATAFMPQWQLKVNEKFVDIQSDASGLITSTSQFEPGSYQLDLAWQSTLIEKIGYIITALSVIVMIGLLFV